MRIFYFFFFFFFSSRRRHTRSDRDWSSDVCSSDLLLRSNQGEAIGNWIARNVNLELPNFRNGYRPGVGISVTPTPRLTISGKFTARCSFCREREQDFGIPIPDGWSVGIGVAYRFGK